MTASLNCYVSCKCGAVRPAPVNALGNRLQAVEGAIRRAKSHNANGRRKGLTCNASVYREGGILVWRPGCERSNAATCECGCSIGQHRGRTGTGSCTACSRCHAFRFASLASTHRSP